MVIGRDAGLSTLHHVKVVGLLVSSGCENVFLPWLSPLQRWDNLTMSFLIYIYIYNIYIYIYIYLYIIYIYVHICI